MVPGYGGGGGGGGLSKDWALVWSSKESTVCVCVMKEACESVVTVFKIYCIPALKKIVYGLRRGYTFPQCPGAIDATHTPIVSPAQCSKEYHNRQTPRPFHFLT